MAGSEAAKLAGTVNRPDCVVPKTLEPRPEPETSPVQSHCIRLAAIVFLVSVALNSRALPIRIAPSSGS